MNIDYIRKYAEEHLSPKRLKHTEGVVEMALRLSDAYGLTEEDINKVEVACRLHDLFRGEAISHLDEMVRKYGLDEKYLGNANLSHGKLAACFAKEELGIDDEDILNAINNHTTGRYGMNMIEKIVFIADATEPGRDYPGVEELRETALTDIDKACLMSIQGTIKHLVESGMKEEEIDRDTLEAREYFIKKEKIN